MKLNCDAANKYPLVIATDNWRGRIAQGLGCGEEDIEWCAEVYEATAIVTERVKEDGSTLVIIMIDSISNEELDIFGTLSRIDNVKTVAISVVNNKQKTNLAKQKGANEVLLLSELSLLSAGWVQPGPFTKLPGNVSATPGVSEASGVSDVPDLPDVSEVPQKDGPQSTVKYSTPGKPVRKAPLKTNNEKNTSQPMLSREELDALLGK